MALLQLRLPYAFWLLNVVLRGTILKKRNRNEVNPPLDSQTAHDRTAGTSCRKLRRDGIFLSDVISCAASPSSLRVKDKNV